MTAPARKQSAARVVLNARDSEPLAVRRNIRMHARPISKNIDAANPIAARYSN